MRTLPDKAFQLAIADPPYGIGEDGAKNHSRSKAAKAQEYTPKDWDGKAPDKEFFNELFRVCRHLIIWGANHFIENLPRQNASCWVIWDKENGENDFADCEMAWTSFPTAVRRFKFRWAGMLQGDMAHKEERIHPTQKPVALYAWLLKNYAKPGDRIFDPMMGSQSSRIAAYKMGFDYVGCELDKEYFDKGCERFNRECKGEIKTKDGHIIKQTTLW
jgi:site-specific DNA-methyltransferase (adenine-specific)